jgi:hypothetical protein
MAVWTASQLQPTQNNAKQPKCKITKGKHRIQLMRSKSPTRVALVGSTYSASNHWTKEVISLLKCRRFIRHMLVARPGFVFNLWWEIAAPITRQRSERAVYFDSTIIYRQRDFRTPALLLSCRSRAFSWRANHRWRRGSNHHYECSRDNATSTLPRRKYRLYATPSARPR